MKFILLNIDKNIRKIQIINNVLESNCYINEICIPEKLITKRIEGKNKIVRKVSNYIIDKRITTKIIKGLEQHKERWNYLLKNDLDECSKECKYLINICNQNLGYKLNEEYELDNNLTLHIRDYMTTNKLKQTDIKVLIVAGNNNNVNLELVKKLIQNYKTVNIYIKENVSKYIQKQIKRINDYNGSTIEIIKREKKAFQEYNVVYFVDDLKQNYPRFRFDKSAYVLDIKDKEKDKYNKNILFLKEYIESGNVDKKILNKLCSNYGKLKVANMVEKLHSTIDKATTLI